MLKTAKFLNENSNKRETLTPTAWAALVCSRGCLAVPQPQIRRGSTLFSFTTYLLGARGIYLEMKKLLPFALFALMSINLWGQPKTRLPEPVIKEFAEHFDILTHYDNNYTNMIFTFIHKRQPSLSKVYVNELLINIATKKEGQDIVFQAYYDIARYFGNPLEEYLSISLLKLNLKESTTRTIKNYILENYRTPITIEQENIEAQKNKTIKDEQFLVVTDKAYFHNEPDQSTKRRGYLVNGERFTGVRIENDFVYTLFTNAKGIETRGWIKITDVKKNEVEENSSPTYEPRQSKVSASFNLNERVLLSLPKPKYTGNEEGVIVVKVTVDKEGLVVAAEVIARSSNTDNPELIAAARAAALQAKFNADSNAIEDQSGTITYRFVLD